MFLYSAVSSLLDWSQCINFEMAAKRIRIQAVLNEN